MWSLVLRHEFGDIIIKNYKTKEEAQQEINNREALIELVLDFILWRKGNFCLASSCVGLFKTLFSSWLLIKFIYLHLLDSKIKTVNIRKIIDTEI